MKLVDAININYFFHGHEWRMYLVILRVMRNEMAVNVILVQQLAVSRAQLFRMWSVMAYKITLPTRRTSVSLQLT